MKAIVYTEYGPPDVLHLKEVTKPAPGDDEILIKVHAVSINTGDRYTMRGSPFPARMDTGLLKPSKQILGIDIAGQVEAVGQNITQFQPGDAVYGDNTEGLGGFAEYVCARTTAFVTKPASVTFEEAAAVPTAGVTALQSLRDHGHIQAGQSVLINGASGGVGSFAVQIAKAFGAEVTGVCSTRHVQMVRSIGADHVIDYTQQNFTQTVQGYDLILGVNGYRSLSDYKRALNPGGIYVVVGGTMAQLFGGMLLGPLMSLVGDKKLGGMGSVRPNQDDLVIMNGLLETGKVKPVIDKSFPLSETKEAMQYLDEGHVSGKVVITVGPSN